MALPLLARTFSRACRALRAPAPSFALALTRCALSPPFPYPAAFTTTMACSRQSSARQTGVMRTWGRAAGSRTCTATPLAAGACTAPRTTLPSLCTPRSLATPWTATPSTAGTCPWTLWGTAPPWISVAGTRTAATPTTTTRRSSLAPPLPRLPMAWQLGRRSLPPPRACTSATGATSQQTPWLTSRAPLQTLATLPAPAPPPTTSSLATASAGLRAPATRPRPR